MRLAEAGDRLALFPARVVEAVDGLPERDRVKQGLSLARALVATLASELGKTKAAREPARRTDPLALLARQPDGSPETLGAPLIPLLDTTLLTNAPGEPRVGNQLLAEVASAERIDMVMAFIRRSGIRPLLDAFRRHCEQEVAARTHDDYTGSTELKALRMLDALGAEVRVSYDTRHTPARQGLALSPGQRPRTAYVGSSNLTHSAQVSGLEWNVRASGARNPDLVAKIAAVFEAYWESGDFVPFVDADVASESPRQRPTTQVLLLRPRSAWSPFRSVCSKRSRSRGNVASTGICWSPPPARARP